MQKAKVSDRLAEYLSSQKQLNSDIHNQEIEGIVSYDDGVIMQEYDEGPELGEFCGIPRMKEKFSWKKTFQNVWVGYPNDGKSQYTLFMMVAMTLKNSWKWVIWSPEMRGANYVGGRVVVNYNDLVNQIIWMVSGKTPYNHISLKYKIEKVNRATYIHILEWVKKYFIFIDPKDRTSKGIFKILDSVYQDVGYDGVFIDPFKNIKQESNKRDDIWLEEIFSEANDFSVIKNISFNWVAHPKANIQRIKVVNGQEVLKPCDQWMINGGAAWNNSMDGIYSIFRPEALTDVKDPTVYFINLKQRQQELVAERGTLTDIKFDLKTRRYLFTESDPMDLLIRNETQELPF